MRTDIKGVTLLLLEERLMIVWRILVWFQFLYKCVLFTISYGWLLSKYLANHGITSRKIINEVIVPEWCCASIYHRRRCYLIFQQRVQFKATPASNWKLCFINLVANKYHMIHLVVRLYGQLCYVNPKIKYHMNCTIMMRVFFKSVVLLNHDSEYP